ncbi:MAG: hypothetical protein ACTJLM_01560 [Ehrlichia sp.]
MSAGGVVAIVAVVALLMLLAIALYYAVKKLCESKLHVKSYERLESRPSTAVTKTTLERCAVLDRNYLSSTMEWLPYELRAVYNMQALMQDLKFQLSALRNYELILCSIMEVYISKEEISESLVKNMDEAVDKMRFHYGRIECKLSDCLRDEVVKDKAVGSEDIKCASFNCQLLNAMGQQLLNFIYSVFDVSEERQVIESYTMNVRSIMSEVDRKIMIYDAKGSVSQQQR